MNDFEIYVFLSGFHHQQSRSDRHRFVKINWENIETDPKDMSYNFDKCTDCTNQTLPYDFDSIMHYTSDAFSKNGKPTIQRLDCPECLITPKNTFSALDVKGINMLYSCSNPGK